MPVFAIPNPKKSTIVEFPIEKIKKCILNIPLISNSYTFEKSNEIFNQYTFSSFEFLSLGVYIDINLNMVASDKTEIQVEIRRKMGTFNQPQEVTYANNHLDKVYTLIAELASKDASTIDKLILEKQNKESIKKAKEKRIRPLTFIFLFLTIILVYKLCSNSAKSNYENKALPANFSYKVIKDNSNENVDKNQLYVQLSNKINTNQIATIANELYKSKQKRSRFYIFYSLKGKDNKSQYWAISHFDPDLKITINGSTNEEDEIMKKEAEKVDGKILGIFFEENYTSSFYTIYENKDSFNVKQIFKDGTSMISKMNKSNSVLGLKISSNLNESNREYYILKNDILEFYNKENKKFTSAERFIR